MLRKRDADITGIAEKVGVKVHMIEDYLLAPIGTYLKPGSGKDPYTIYTPLKIIFLILYLQEKK